MKHRKIREQHSAQCALKVKLEPVMSNFPIKNESVLNLEIDVAGCVPPRLVQRFL
jgi:hypothetical protein